MFCSPVTQPSSSVEGEILLVSYASISFVVANEFSSISKQLCIYMIVFVCLYAGLVLVQADQLLCEQWCLHGL